MRQVERSYKSRLIKEHDTIFDHNTNEIVIHTIDAKMIAIAKAGEPAPSWRPIANARADTVAECDEGIPPESSILLESHFFSLYLSI